MDVAIFESEQVIVIRTEGREPYPIHRSPVRSFEPIPGSGHMGRSGWVEIAPSREPTAVCVAPPGSELFRRGDKLLLRCKVPRLDLSKPTVLDADWLLSWSNCGAYGFRRREPAVRAEAVADAGVAVPLADAPAGLAVPEAEAPAVDAAAAVGAAMLAGEHPAVEPERLVVAGPPRRSGFLFDLD